MKSSKASWEVWISGMAKGVYARSEVSKSRPSTMTARIGPTLQMATTPNASSSLPVRAARPAPIAMMNGTVMGPVVTPPESNATARNSAGTKHASKNTKP